MAEKKRTKKELIEAILDHEEAALRNIVHGFPHQLRDYIKRLMRIKTLTKIELELHHIFQEAPSQRAYLTPLTKVIPENVVLSEDDPLLPIIKVADEAYGDGLVMDYYKVPTGEFGDTLASFIVRELEGALMPDGANAETFEAAAHLLTAAAGQLDDVAEALAREAGKMRNPDNLWQKVVFNSGSIKNEDGTRKCPACGGNYDECPCPGPTQSYLYEYRTEDDIMYARRKDGTLPLGKVVADRVEKTTQEVLSDPEVFTNKPESPIRKMDSDEDKKTKSMFQEMLSDEDRTAESNLILAANSVKEIVCPNCGSKNVEYSEYVLRLFAFERKEDNKLVFDSAGQTMAWEDTKDEGLCCRDCNHLFPIPEGMTCEFD